MDNYWRLGLFALSLNEISRRAGISKPALYREFGGEDGLMAAVLEFYGERVVAPRLELLLAERPFAATLEGAIVGLTSDDGTPAGCLLTKMRVVKSRLGPATAQRVRLLEEEQLSAFETLYRRALARGEANPEFSPKFAARYLDTQVASVLVQIGIGVAPELVRKQARLTMRPMLQA